MDGVTTFLATTIMPLNTTTLVTTTLLTAIIPLSTITIIISLIPPPYSPPPSSPPPPSSSQVRSGHYNNTLNCTNTSPGLGRKCLSYLRFRRQNGPPTWATGEVATTPFGVGYGLGCAFVDGDADVYVYASKEGSEVMMWSSDSISLQSRWEQVCVSACACVCVHACVCLCLCACVVDQCFPHITTTTTTTT